jgi:hypothetical protein
MLEPYSHVRIDAKRQALDALDEARRGAEKNGNASGGEDGDTNGDAPEPPDNDADIPLFVAPAEGLTSQSRRSLRLSGSPPHGKLLIPLERRDVRRRLSSRRVRRGIPCRGRSRLRLAVKLVVVLLGHVGRRVLDEADQRLCGFPARGISQVGRSRVGYQDQAKVFDATGSRIIGIASRIRPAASRGRVTAHSRVAMSSRLVRSQTSNE